jgi:hypothetical protein
MFITGLLMVGGGLFIRAMDIKNENKVMLDKIIKESANIREEARTNAGNDRYSKRNQEPSFNENIQDFTQPSPGNERPVDFTPPPKNGGVEVVAAEDAGDGDNA